MSEKKWKCTHTRSRSRPRTTHLARRAGDALAHERIGECAPEAHHRVVASVAVHMQSQYARKALPATAQLEHARRVAPRNAAEQRRPQGARERRAAAADCTVVRSSTHVVCQHMSHIVARLARRVAARTHTSRKWKTFKNRPENGILKEFVQKMESPLE